MPAAHRPYAGPRLIRFLAAATVVIGAASAFWGVAYAINGATQAPAYVTVPVAYKHPLDHPEPAVGLTGPRLPEGVRLRPAAGELDLTAWDSTVLEQLLARGGVAVTGVCLGVAAVLVRRVLLSVVEGEPFRAGNPARIAGLAGLVAFAGVAGAVLAHISASSVLGRLDLAGSFVTGVSIPLEPVLVALLLLVLAEAFRHGGELAEDVVGTV
ncbi:hypothetical protein Psi02_53250 [Planotetraspora silvatica]|uniref:DUF2975 domain-containing protein n=1 Tax=Planotetraspora silvatica TaxID=234614 RepID=A0A8J3USX8_9ACTN|nr:DUF2975 domain-containing protein [Planotetraspora silvatica]GII48901.1 hypothetical protein Psi02_53250 [Planotetraspora silvatica]